MPKLTDTEQPLSDDDLDEFERKLARPLPLSFRNHYRMANGGSPAEEDVENGRWGLPVHGFNSIKYGDLPIEMLIDDYDELIPKDNSFGCWARRSFVPFAYDAGGHPIFLSLRDSDYGAVYIYDPDGGSIGSIADNFEEFRLRLYGGERSER